MIKINETFTGRFERPMLLWSCRHLPLWITPDMLTGLGLTGAAVSFLGFSLSSHGNFLLWLAILGLVVNWFGDSLDGSLARHRKLERPKYGFFLDHITDTLSMGLIAIGMGLSPYAHLTCALAVLSSYYTMVILSMVTCLVTGVFRISFNGIGPTEIRLFIAMCTAAAARGYSYTLEWRGLSITVYDGIILAGALVLVIACLFQAARTAGQLAIVDQPKRPSD